MEDNRAMLRMSQPRFHILCCLPFLVAHSRTVSGGSCNFALFECLSILNVRTQFGDINVGDIRQLQTAHEEHLPTYLIYNSCHILLRSSVSIT